MIEIVTSGRDDLADFFRIGNLLILKKLTHHPYLAYVRKFVDLRDELHVEVIDTTEKLLTLPDATKVMQQWPGKWRSDFMRFTVGDVRAELMRRGMIQPELPL